MKVEQVLHMNGVGKHSYASNSSLQRTVISMVKPILEINIVELYRAMLPECFKIADLGCSSRPNTLLVVSYIIDIIDETRRTFTRDWNERKEKTTSASAS